MCSSDLVGAGAGTSTANIESEKCLRLRLRSSPKSGPGKDNSGNTTEILPEPLKSDPETEPEPEDDQSEAESNQEQRQQRCTPSAFVPRSLMGLFDKIKRGGSLKKSGSPSQAAPHPLPKVTVRPAPPSSSHSSSGSDSESEPDFERQPEPGPELEPSCVRIAGPHLALCAAHVARPRASSLKGPLALPIGWGPPQTRRVSFSEAVLIKGLGDDPGATFVASLAPTSQELSPQPSPRQTLSH